LGTSDSAIRKSKTKYKKRGKNSPPKNRQKS
jgi:hypothetical protein